MTQNCGNVKYVRNVRKAKRAKRDSYTTTRGKLVAAKKMKPCTFLNNKGHKCSENVSEEKRQLLFDSFYKLGTIDNQRQFISDHVSSKVKGRCTVKGKEQSRRNFTKEFAFTISGEKKTVCRNFFMETLTITEALIRSSLYRKKTEVGTMIPDFRGKHPKGNQVSSESLKIIHEHIASLPAKESHYCRKSSKKLYLDETLSIAKMYDLYKVMQKDNNRKAVSYEKYCRIFVKYNIAFFKPKKDHCATCTKFLEMSDTEKKLARTDYESHLKRKNEARVWRDEDKKFSQENQNILSFNFDLRGVLCTPKAAAGQLFYTRKLAVYNFTIYHLGDHKGFCNIWDECNGKRGANERAF